VLVTEGPFEAFSLQADPAGVIDALRRVTVTDQAGRWSLHLHGVQSGVDQRFTLYGTRLSLSRTQATASVATSLQVCWSGFPSSELLQLVSQPAGLLGAANPRTDGDGNGCLDTQLRTDAPPGSYTVRLAGQASGFVVQHDFRLTVPGAPFLTLNTSSFDYALVQGGGPADQWLSIGDASEGTTLTWTATTSTTDAGKWLSISGASGSASLGAPSWILVHVDPAGLGAGIHAHWRRCQ